MERFGFEFGEFGFTENHVHFQVNIPKQYSIQDAEIMLKSYTAQRKYLKHIKGSGSGTHKAASGVDTNIMSLLDKSTLNNPQLIYEINNDITT